MRQLLAVMALAASGFSGQADAYTNAPAMFRAVQRAVWDNREARDVHFYTQGTYSVDPGHEFHIKPPRRRVAQEGGGYRVSGQISRELRARRDDQYFYFIQTNHRDEIIAFSERINAQREWTALVLPPETSLGRRQARDPITLGAQHSVTPCRRLHGQDYLPSYADVGNDDWRRGARCIAIAIATAASQGRPPARRRDYRQNPN